MFESDEFETRLPFYRSFYRSFRGDLCTHLYFFHGQKVIYNNFKSSVTIPDMKAILVTHEKIPIAKNFKYFN